MLTLTFVSAYLLTDCLQNKIDPYFTFKYCDIYISFNLFRIVTRYLLSAILTINE